MENESTSSLDAIVAGYLRDIAAQTRGSYRTRRASKLGTALVNILRLIPETAGEQTIASYLERAQLRTKVAQKYLSRKPGADERANLLLSLLERDAFKIMLQLDEMEALEAILRVRRCARCSSWFWSRVDSQRYCSSDCRTRHYQQSPEGRKYKREWARNAYWRDKERDRRVRKFISVSGHAAHR